MGIFGQILFVLSLVNNQHLNSIEFEFQKHYESLNQSCGMRNCKIGICEECHPYTSLAEHVIQKLLDQESDKYFISDRRLLRKLKAKQYSFNHVEIDDTLSSGEHCNVTISLGPFNPENHGINYDSNRHKVHSIDGMYPFGSSYQIPKRQIAKLAIKIDGKKVWIPDRAYQNLYKPDLYDTFLHWRRNLEVYESMNGRYLYLYISGGNAAGTYFCKLVFNKKKYLTRILVEYYHLSIYHSFHKNFLGF